MNNKQKKLVIIIFLGFLIIGLAVVLVGIRKTLTTGGEAAGSSFWWQTRGRGVTVTPPRTRPLPTREPAEP